MNPQIKESYQFWLIRRPDSVAKAVDSLRAYHELIGYELMLLYAPWFRKQRSWLRGHPLGCDVRPEDLPRTLSEIAREAIDRTRFEQSMLRPIGKYFAPKEVVTRKSISVELPSSERREDVEKAVFEKKFEEIEKKLRQEIQSAAEDMKDVPKATGYTMNPTQSPSDIGRSEVRPDTRTSGLD